MKSLLFATATALSLAATPTLAQQADAPLGSTNSVSDKRDYTPEQQAVYDALEAEQRTTFDTWPYERQLVYFGMEEPMRTYYWTLETEQRPVWLALSPSDRLTVVHVADPSDRADLWSELVAQYSVGTPLADMDINYESKPVVQDHAQHSGDYPVCEGDADDTCVNAWEAGERGTGVTRPLDYWPGEPASS